MIGEAFTAQNKGLFFDPEGSLEEITLEELFEKHGEGIRKVKRLSDADEIKMRQAPEALIDWFNDACEEVCQEHYAATGIVPARVAVFRGPVGGGVSIEVRVYE